MLPPASNSSAKSAHAPAFTWMSAVRVLRLFVCSFHVWNFVGRFAKILPDELFTRNQRTCASQPPLFLTTCIYNAGGGSFSLLPQGGQYNCTTVGGWFFNTCEIKLKCPPVLLSKPFLIPHPREANKQFRNLRTFSKDDNQITKY